MFLFPEKIGGNGLYVVFYACRWHVCTDFHQLDTTVLSARRPFYFVVSEIMPDKTWAAKLVSVKQSCAALHFAVDIPNSCKSNEAKHEFVRKKLRTPASCC